MISRRAACLVLRADGGGGCDGGGDGDGRRACAMLQSDTHVVALVVITLHQA